MVVKASINMYDINNENEEKVGRKSITDERNLMLGQFIAGISSRHKQWKRKLLEEFKISLRVQRLLSEVVHLIRKPPPSLKNYQY